MKPSDDITHTTHKCAATDGVTVAEKPLQKEPLTIERLEKMVAEAETNWAAGNARLAAVLSQYSHLLSKRAKRKQRSLYGKR